MAWNGAGTYTRNNGTYTGTTVWQQDASAGTKITASNHDTHDQDVATALNNCLCKDGQNTPTANLPMGSYKHTGVGNAAARDSYAAAGQVIAGSLVYASTVGGTADAITLTLGIAPASYTAGLRVYFIAGSSNTGAVTVDVNSLGTKDVKDVNGNALPANAIRANQLVEIVYNGTAFLMSQIDVNGANAEIAVTKDSSGWTIGLATNPVIPGTSANQFLYTDGSGFLQSQAASAQRTALGLDTMAEQAASSVAITGGSIAGITDLAVADGGTGASNAATARTNLSAAASGANSDITSLTAVTSVTRNGGLLAVGTASAHALRLQTNATTQVEIDSSGNVYPGTTNSTTNGTSANCWQSTYSVGIQGISIADFTVKAQTSYGIQFVVGGATNAARFTSSGILNFQATMGNSTKNPTADAPADWVQIEIGGTTYYLPAYAA